MQDTKNFASNYYANGSIYTYMIKFIEKRSLFKQMRISLY